MDAGVQGPGNVVWVFDSSAVIAYVQDEPGSDTVERALMGGGPRFMHAINLCEIFYDTARRDGEPSARSLVRDLLDSGLIVRADMDSDFWHAAGLLKAQQHRVSLADCFCVTLARRLGGRILTCDHHEFDRIAPLGLCAVEFAR